MDRRLLKELTRGKEVQRTPPLSERVVEVIEEGENPFQSRGLRRSPQAVPDIVIKNTTTYDRHFIRNSLPTLDKEIYEYASDSDVNFSNLDLPKSPNLGKQQSILGQSEPHGSLEEKEKLATGSSKKDNDRAILENSLEPLEKQPVSTTTLLNHNSSEKYDISRGLKESQESFFDGRHDSRSIMKQLPTVSDPKATNSPFRVLSESDKSARLHHNLSEDLINQSLDPGGDSSLSQYLSPKTQVKTIQPEVISNVSETSLPQRPTPSASLPDTYKEKELLKKALLQELEKLRSDIALADKVNERLRSSTISIKRKSPEDVFDKEVISMLLRATSIHSQNYPDQSADEKKSTFENLHHFLPFNSRRRRISRLQAQTEATTIDPSDETDINKNSSSSAADNALPYLQAFTPLIWSSTISIIYGPREAESELEEQGSKERQDLQLLQQQIITASHPQGLFSARLALTVEPISQTINNISILSLPLCAEQELGSFIRKVPLHQISMDTLQANDDEEKINSHLSSSHLDIGVACYAMSRWFQISLRRAKFWWLVIHCYSTPEARNRFLPLHRHKIKKLANFARKKKKRKHTGDEVEDDSGENNTLSEDEDGEEICELKTGKQIRSKLLPHLGRSMFCIDARSDSKGTKNDGIQMLFEWHISFDWTGHKSSHSKSHGFDQIPFIFEKLVQEKGPFAAVTGTLSLVMPEE
ncbi:hypothetical protein GcM1_208037 [Golovinomyces cichoracearum]|uniref:Uncharacterized protein n=1 Tax=Golovinomyces cichoracearum TaxID=62708 RepID=A0A420IW64_9PEZI|nr:hypothetical protein GcM1_208037 [Golovinomyces cichoracearum]